ncbi:ABC transporter ATP-binding protein [Agrobacterium tumefaciens]|nr:ABC transporter ATP-binding protein [Agrobacterium tumefaciens]TQN62438.1 ABC transporter ATP-binding protein [Agrobacterium tumefaciens]
MLRVDRIVASYGPIQALDRVSVEVEEGKFVALLGANGAGKSTTLNCISGLVPIREGSITFEGQRIDTLSPEQIVERGVVQVPEGREIFHDMSVRDNLILGAWLRRRDRSVSQDLDRIFHIFPRLQERNRQHAGTLSGGEQQMLMIGRALMARPKLLLLDEPSLGLSPVLVESVFKTLAELHNGGLTLLVVEQNAQLALAMSSYSYILENGEMAAHGASQELRTDPRVRAAYLGT